MIWRSMLTWKSAEIIFAASQHACRCIRKYKHWHSQSPSCTVENFSMTHVFHEDLFRMKHYKLSTCKFVDWHVISSARERVHNTQTVTRFPCFYRTESGEEQESTLCCCCCCCWWWSRAAQSTLDFAGQKFDAYRAVEPSLAAAAEGAPFAWVRRWASLDKATLPTTVLSGPWWNARNVFSTARWEQMAEDKTKVINKMHWNIF